MQVFTEKSAYAVIGLYRGFGTVITGAVPARIILLTALETAKVDAFKMVVEPFKLSDAAIANAMTGSLFFSSANRIKADKLKAEEIMEEANKIMEKERDLMKIQTDLLDKERDLHERETRVNATEAMRNIMPLPVTPYTFDQVSQATLGFHESRLIGEGGYGPVFQGLLSGFEVAVKRLKVDSTQGINEFKTEIRYLADLAHINIVKIRGYCTENGEKIIVYQYISGGSLLNHLEDSSKKAALTWEMRHKVMCDVAAGLYYLHVSSAKNIIHRDIKPANILLDVLDGNVNACITDFGMAKHADEQGYRIAGTRGYYDLHYVNNQGPNKGKSDVYSYGVMMMVILTGRRRPFAADGQTRIVAEAWRRKRENQLLSLMDPLIQTSCTNAVFEWAFQLAFLCVQNDPDLRPNAGELCRYIQAIGHTLPQPRPPISDITDSSNFFNAYEQKKKNIPFAFCFNSKKK